MEELIKLRAKEIAQIIMDCEFVQNSNESAYTKEMAQIHAYLEIKELVTGVIDGIVQD